MTTTVMELDNKKLDKNSVRVSHLDEIALHIQVDWEIIATYIGLSEVDQKDIKEKYKGNYRLQKRQALRRWRNINGNKATLASLVQIFHDHGQVELADTAKKVSTQQPTCIPVLQKYLRYYYGDIHQQNKSNQHYGLQDLYEYCINFPNTYTELTLHEIPLEGMLDGKQALESVQHAVKPVKLNEVFNTGGRAQRLVIFFEGVTGSGKTTLSWHLSAEWAEQRLLQQFQLLIHVQLHEYQKKNAGSLRLADFIPDPAQEIREEIEAAIIDNEGRSVCLILEGLDEVTDDMWKLFLFDLIRGKVGNMELPFLSCIITTRPDVRKLKEVENVLTSRIIIKGFNRKNLVEFFNSRLSFAGDKLRDIFDTNPQLEALCSLPINAAIMTFLIHFYTDELPITQTGLYHPLVSNFLIRHIQKQDSETLPEAVEDFSVDLADYPITKKEFYKLCQFAYSAVQAKERIFSKKELIKEEIEVDEKSLGILQFQVKNTMSGTKEYYSFTHFSLQEFLAAVHIKEMESSDQVCVIKDFLAKDPLCQVLPFYAGLTQLSNREAFKILSQVMKQPLTDTSIVTALLKDPTTSNDPRRKALALFNCLYESQMDELIADLDIPTIKSHVPNSLCHISFNSFNLTPTDCTAIGYYLRNAAQKPSKLIFYLTMGECTDSGLSSFARELRKDVDLYPKEESAIHIPKVAIYLPSVLILNEPGAQSFKELLQGRSNVGVLQIRLAEETSLLMKVKTMKYIIEGLSNRLFVSGFRLLDVNLLNFGLNHSHVPYYVLLFRAQMSLEKFSMCGCSLQKGMTLLSGAIRYSNLKALSLQQCNIDDAALKCLGRGVCKNEYLETLDIEYNPYTVDGIVVFLKYFTSKESVLTELMVNKEGLKQLTTSTEYHTLLMKILAVRWVLKKPVLTLYPGIKAQDILKGKDISGSIEEGVLNASGLRCLPPSYSDRNDN